MQEADGGPNTIENTIVLCFDCHADAGHYNPRHPRGTRFSPREVRLARDEWFRRVAEEGTPQPAPAPEVLYARYLICREMEILLELAGSDLSRVPVSEPILLPNDVYRFWQQILADQRETWRHARLWGDDFEDHEDYERVHPDAQVIDRGDPGNPYFDARRTLDVNEAEARVGAEDPITRLLLEAGHPVEEITECLAYLEVCGANRIQEVYRVRPLWFTLLALTNTGDEAIRVSTLSGVVRPGGTRDLHDFSVDPPALESQDQSLPQVRILPHATVLIPVATLLAPLGHISPEVLRAEDEELAHARIQVFEHVSYDASDLSRIGTWGPRHWVSSVEAGADDDMVTHEIHTFDPANVYVLDRYWEMGCCPHVFSVQDGYYTYLGELFTTPLVTETLAIEPPAGSSAIIIAELESERCEIDAVLLAGRPSLTDLTLARGQWVEIRMGGHPVAEVRGRYVPDSSAVLTGNPWEKNALIADFLSELRRRPASSAG